jgi:thiamine pyrophosphate-dependent acetolactate synthase large subunit-like protein
MISASTPTHTHGTGWGVLHEIIDQDSVTKPLTALTATVSAPDELPVLVGEAFTIFGSQRPRPVHISIPVDVGDAMVEGDWEPVPIPPRPSPDVEAVSKAAELLLGAERPALYLGGGAIGADISITAIAERLNATVITSNAGKGIVPESHRLSIGGSIWRQPTQDHLVAADVVLAIGTEIGETDSFVEKIPLGGRLIRVDIDSSKIDDLYKAEVGIVADARAASDAILEALGPSQPTVDDAEERVSATKAAVRKRLTATERQHVVALDAIRRALPADTILMNDIAQLVYTGSAMFPVELPRTWNYPAGFCVLGCGLPDAIGAKLAFPERPVATLVGDGGFMFTPQELITASELGLPIPIVVWSNGGLKQITDDMTSQGIEPIGTSGVSPDFVMLAQSMGAHGVRPQSVQDLEQTLKAALVADRPTVIELVEDSEWLTGPATPPR